MYSVLSVLILTSAVNTLPSVRFTIDNLFQGVQSNLNRLVFHHDTTTSYHTVPNHVDGPRGNLHYTIRHSATSEHYTDHTIRNGLLNYVAHIIRCSTTYQRFTNAGNRQAYLARIGVLIRLSLSNAYQTDVVNMDRHQSVTLLSGRAIYAVNTVPLSDSYASRYLKGFLLTAVVNAFVDHRTGTTYTHDY